MNTNTMMSPKLFAAICHSRNNILGLEEKKRSIEDNNPQSDTLTALLMPKQVGAVSELLPKGQAKASAKRMGEVMVDP